VLIHASCAVLWTTEFDTPQLKGLSSDENPTLAAFRTLPSGVQVTDIQV
jgi:hypothetical protein